MSSSFIFEPSPHDHEALEIGGVAIEKSEVEKSSAGEDKKSTDVDILRVAKMLSPFSSALLQQLPDYVATGMLDAKLRGNRSVNLALIETERMLADMTKAELKTRYFNFFFFLSR